MRAEALALLTLFLASCGGEDPASSAPRLAVERLFLEADVERDPEPRLVARYRPDAEGAAWTGPGDRPYEVVGADERPAARAQADGPTNVRIPATLRTTAFDSVQVDFRLPGGADELLRVSLLEGRDTVLVSELRSVRGTGEFETESFALESIDLHDVELSELSVQLAGDAAWREVSELRALDARPAALLPAPGEPAELIDVGSEARRGWGLDPEVGARLRERVVAGQTLHVSVAQHPGAEGTQLRVSDGSITYSTSLGSEEPRWSTFTIGPFADDRLLDVSLKVVGQPKTPSLAWTAVAEVQLETGVDDGAAPLVLLVTSDTHRGDHLSRGGTPGLVDTPRLDALASRGIQWTDAYAPSNMTNPSHVALMTGLSPRDSRIVGNRAPLGEGAVTLAERFADAGWATAAVVSVQHIGHAYSGLGQGFDRFDGLERRADYAYGRRDGAIAVERALRWIEEERSDLPLFLWVHVFDVHAPYAAPEPFERRYLKEAARPVESSLDPVPRNDLPSWIAEDPTQRAEVTAAHARYRAAVDRLDEVLGPLWELPRVRAGVVGFTGDHGEAFGRNELWWTHHGLYRDQLHVPLILVAPGLEAGRVTDAPAEVIDLGATLLGLAGLNAADHPSPPIALEPGPRSPRFALGYSGLKAAIEHEGWLLVLSLQDHDFDKGPRSFQKGALELYHVAIDPGCATERSQAEPERTARMREALVRWLNDARGRGFATAFNIDERAQRRLVELGYAGNIESTREGAWFTEEDGPR